MMHAKHAHACAEGFACLLDEQGWRGVILSGMEGCIASL